MRLHNDISTVGAHCPLHEQNPSHFINGEPLPVVLPAATDVFHASIAMVFAIDGLASIRLIRSNQSQHVPFLDITLFRSCNTK